MMETRSKEIDIKAEVQGRMETREPCRGETVVMVVQEFARQFVSTNITRARIVNSLEPYVTGQAIIPQAKGKAAKSARPSTAHAVNITHSRYIVAEDEERDVRRIAEQRFHPQEDSIQFQDINMKFRLGKGPPTLSEGVGMRKSTPTN